MFRGAAKGKKQPFRVGLNGQMRERIKLFSVTLRLLLFNIMAALRMVLGYPAESCRDYYGEDICNHASCPQKVSNRRDFFDLIIKSGGGYEIRAQENMLHNKLVHYLIL